MQWCASVLHRCQLLVPPESLQLDLFVTNFNPPISHYLGSNDTGNLMSPGTPDISSSSAPSASIKVKGIALDQNDLNDAQMPDDRYADLTYYIGDYTENGELGHEEDQLDLTNFDGDNDDRVQGESTLNRALKKEGTIRRAITRKRTESRRTKRFLETGVDSKSGRLPDLPTPPMEAGQSLLSPPVRSLEETATPRDDTFGRRPATAISSHLSAQSFVPPMARTPSPIGWDVPGHGSESIGGSQHWKRISTTSMVSQASSTQALMREVVEEPQLELGEQEMRDINIVAEFARPGRPKVDLILRDEVGMAGGRIVVACEWPMQTSFPVLLSEILPRLWANHTERGSPKGGCSSD